MTSVSTNVNTDEQKPKKNPFRKKLNIFLVCLFISFVMWLMIRLSRDYIMPVKFSLDYKGIKNTNILTPTTDSLLTVDIQTSGYNIIYHRIFPKVYKITIDISQYTPRLNKKHFEINIETATLNNLIASYLKFGEKVVSISPSSINIKLDDAYTRKLPVKADIELSFAKQYNLYSKIIIKPDSVYVTGNKDYIDTMKFVKTEKKVFSNLSTNTIATLTLINPLNKYSLRYSAETVKVFIPVAQFTENSIELPLYFDTLQDDYQLLTYPDKVTVYYLVAIPDYSRVVADSFHLGFNNSKLFESSNNIAKIEVKKSPSFVKIQRIEPSSVEFLIRKK